MEKNLPSLEESSLEFTCVHEADVNPTPDPEADEWFKKARRIEKGQEAGSPEEVVALYQKPLKKSTGKPSSTWHAIMLMVMVSSKTWTKPLICWSRVCR